jgi:hypothetical protein
LKTDRVTPSWTKDRAIAMLVSAEMQKRLEEAYAQQEKARAKWKAPLREPSGPPAVHHVPTDAATQPLKIDRVTPSWKKDQARAIAMLVSAEMQKRLEEAYAQQEKALAKWKAEPPEGGGAHAGGDDPTVRAIAVSRFAGRSGPTLPVAPTPLCLASVGSSLAPMEVVSGSNPAQPVRRRCWALSLVIGLALGLALSAGLTQLARFASTLSSGALDAAGTSARADPAARTSDVSRDAVAAAGPYVVELVPPELFLVDPPPSDHHLVPMRADRPPVLPGSGSLGAPQAPDGVTVSTANATAPAGAGQWLAPPLPEPETDEQVRFAADSLEEVLRTQPAQALTVPPFSDQPPSLPVEVQVREAPLEAGETVEASMVTLADLRLQIALHLPPDLSRAVLYKAQAALRNAGSDPTSTSIAGFGVAESEVRFFHQEDAPDAARIAEAIGAEARDFSAYRPAPQLGTLEVWLGEEG